MSSRHASNLMHGIYTCLKEFCGSHCWESTVHSFDCIELHGEVRMIIFVQFCLNFTDVFICIIANAMWDGT